MPPRVLAQRPKPCGGNKKTNGNVSNNHELIVHSGLDRYIVIGTDFAVSVPSYWPSHVPSVFEIFIFRPEQVPESFKVIPQYCTAHNNTQKYNGGLPCRKARTREKWAFGKAWLGKRGGNLWQRRKRQLSESVEIVESAKISVLSFSNMAEYSQSRGNLNRCDSLFLLMYTYWCTTYLNQHGDLYFLFHKNI